MSISGRPQLDTGIVLLSYDALGRLTNQVFKGLATNRFVYNGAGDLVSLTDGKWGKTSRLISLLEFD